ncbi:MAG: UDP-N-acetylmuramoyl-L-alanyl-D-glutamate--2,6-diaminopimelate ligase, partial [Patescibacteria group bacterium]
MICHSLEELGFSCGLISTATIKIGERIWLNDLKMTMPGRLKLQRYLRQMVKAGSKYAVVETSSEGIAQWRHLGINYDAAIFTNLTPEHLETHGSWENYVEAKLKLWASLGRSRKKTTKHSGSIPKVSVINGDDPSCLKFLKFRAEQSYLYTIKIKNQIPGWQLVKATIVSSSSREIKFEVSGIPFVLKLGGIFNVYNALAATTYLLSQGFTLAEAARALKTFPGVPGRLEFIETGQPFKVVVDYAHTPESLEAVYQTLTINQVKNKLIAVLGSCGGGRDKDKRSKLGALAGQYADYVIVTNEDPYDEDPQTIIETVAQGVVGVGKEMGKNLWKVLDRRQAITQALGLAKPDDTVVITGKGSEQWLVTRQEKVSWDDRQVVKEEIKKLLAIK